MVGVFLAAVVCGPVQAAFQEGSGWPARVEVGASAAQLWQVRALVAQRPALPGDLVTLPFEVAPEFPPTGAATDPARELFDLVDGRPVYLCPEADPGWRLVTQPRQLSDPSEKQQLLVTVMVPPDALAGSKGTVTLVVAAGAGCGQERLELASGHATVVVGVRRGLQLAVRAPETAMPGRRWVAVAEVFNRGNHEEQVELRALSNLNWQVRVQPAALAVPAFGRREVTLAAQVPDDASAGLIHVVSVEAVTSDGALKQQAYGRTVVDWSGAGRGAAGRAEGRAVQGQLALQAAWQLPNAGEPSLAFSPAPTVTSGLRLDARAGDTGWEAGVSGQWDEQRTRLDWPWLSASDGRGRRWGFGMGMPQPPRLMTQAGTGFPVFSLTQQGPTEADRWGLVTGVDSESGAVQSGMLLFERVSVPRQQGRRTAVAAGVLNHLPGAAAEMRLPLFESNGTQWAATTGLAFSGAPAWSAGLEASHSWWSVAGWWEDREAGYIGSPNAQRRLRLESSAAPGPGRWAAAYAEAWMAEGSAGPGSVSAGVRLQPGERLALQWQQRQALGGGEGAGTWAFLGLFVRGRTAWPTWQALVSRELRDGGWVPRAELRLPEMGIGPVSWQNIVSAEAQGGGGWRLAVDSSAAYRMARGKTSVLAEVSVGWEKEGGIREAVAGLELRRPVTPWLLGQLGVSVHMSPAGSPQTRLLASTLYNFAFDVPVPGGVVRGRVVGWQERKPDYRWPAVGVLVDGEPAGKLAPDGSFVLDGVPAGRHRISLDTRSLPAVWLLAGPPAEVDVAPRRETAVELPVVGAGLLAGTCFADLNGGGVQEADEPVFPGCTVQLTSPDGQALAVSADASGRWQVQGLKPGRYQVQATGSGLPQPVAAVAASAAPWLMWLARPGAPQPLVWQAGPEPVDVQGWPEETSVKLALAPPRLAAAPAFRSGEALTVQLDVEPGVVPPGAEVRVRVRASADLAEAVLTAGDGQVELSGSGPEREAWVQVPRQAGAGPLEVQVTVLDVQGRREERRAIVLIDPGIPLLQVRAVPVVVQTGQETEVVAQALVRLVEAHLETPWGSMPLAPADGSPPSAEWRVRLGVPQDADEGLYTLVVRGKTASGLAVEAPARIRVRRPR